MRFVSVVTSTLLFFSVSLLISAIRSSICPSTGRTDTSGSSSPVGRRICSTRISSCSASYFEGVADTNIIWSICDSNSSKLSGLLSNAEGSLNPYSTNVVFRERSPEYIPPICGIVMWDSSIMIRKSSLK